MPDDVDAAPSQSCPSRGGMQKRLSYKLRPEFQQIEVNAQSLNEIVKMEIKFQYGLSVPLQVGPLLKDREPCVVVANSSLGRWRISNEVS